MVCMKKQIICILTGLALLMAAGCGEIVFPDKNGMEQLREAKSQTTVFSVEGTVVNQEGQPLDGITVVVSGYFHKDTEVNRGLNYREIDTLTTNAEGCYSIPKRTVSPAFTDLDIYAYDSLGIYEPGRCFVSNLKIGSIAPTISLKNKQNAQ